SVSPRTREGCSPPIARVISPKVDRRDHARSMPALPARPMLAAHVLARRHVVDGEALGVLHDRRTGRLVQIGPREWELLAAADGTRDLEGILLAAAREGARARAPALQAFFEQLQDDGMLEDGAGGPAPEPCEAAEDAGDRS